MSTYAPDVTGYVASAQRLREQLGTLATFEIPVNPVWPEGTKINPDTELPFDPTIKPTSGEFTTVEKMVLIILKQGSPLRPQSDTYWEQVGEMSGMDIIVDMAPADWATVELASEMVVNGLTYKIQEAKPFSIGDTLYRWLVYGKER